MNRLPDRPSLSAGDSPECDSPPPEYVRGWWERLSERTQIILMDDPGGIVPDHVAGEVAGADPRCSLYVSWDGPPGSLFLRAIAENYVEQQADLR